MLFFSKLKDYQTIMPDLFKKDNSSIIRLVEGKGELLCLPYWLSEEEQRYYFSLLQRELAWKTEKLLIAGRQVLSPRLVAWYGNPGINYRYSSITHEALPWHQALLILKQKIKEQFAARINSVLGNFYRNGRDSMGWHADSEPELGKDPAIYSLSLGASRFFDYRRRDKSCSKQRIELQPGSLLIMQGSFQEYWLHQIPKQLRVEEPRINLTFRYIHNSGLGLSIRKETKKPV
jgi:alkylated DNA repair dioxygenase AlkB